VTNLADKANPFTVPDDAACTVPLSDDSQKVLAEFSQRIEDLNKPDIPYQKKLDAIIELNTRIVPIVFQQLLSPAPNVDVSVIASRACNALRDASSIIIKKREAEATDDIDPASPKFQLVFGWFLELFSETLHDQKIDEITVSNIFNALAAGLAGWEERVQKSLKGLSSKALDKADNPFIREFKEKLKASICEEPENV